MKASLRWVILALVLIPMFLLSWLLFTGARRLVEEDGRVRVAEFRRNLMDRKRQELVCLSEVAYRATKKYYEQSHPAKIGSVLQARGLEFKSTLKRYYEAHKDRFPKETIQQFMMDFVKAYRFDDGVGYFWINDFHPRMVCHPIKPELNGADLSTYKDSRETFLFNEMVVRCKESDQGFVKYRWMNPKSRREEQKLSFVFTFEPFGWIVGTGEYDTVLRARLQQKAKETMVKLGYSDCGYFWICDYEPVMIAHPINPGLNGTRVGQVADPDGMCIFAEAVRLCRTNGQGFLQYKYPKPGTDDIVPKLTYVRSFEHWQWVIGTGLYLDDVEAAVRQEEQRVDLQVRGLLRRFTSIALPIALILALVATILAAWYVNGPLQRIITSIQSFDNDLTMRVDGSFRFEFADLVQCFNGLISSLEQIVKRLGSVTARISGSATDIAGAVEGQAAQMTEQSAAISEITATVEEMSASSGQIAENAATVLQAARDALDMSRQGATAVSSIAEQMEHIHGDNLARREDINRLGERTREISEVMELINDIAEQTKLIAFNAALEASSAGEAGRRFSVVAAEIRTLADNVKRSTRDIEGKITEIQRVVAGLVESSKASAEGASDGLASSRKTVDLLGSIVDGATETTTAAKQISLSTQQQKTASDQIVAAMREINDGAAETADNISKVSASGQSLTALAAELKELVGRFRVGG